MRFLRSRTSLSSSAGGSGKRVGKRDDEGACFFGILLVFFLNNYLKSLIGDGSFSEWKSKIDGIGPNPLLNGMIKRGIFL